MLDWRAPAPWHVRGGRAAWAAPMSRRRSILTPRLGAAALMAFPGRRPADGRPDARPHRLSLAWRSARCRWARLAGAAAAARRGAADPHHLMRVDLFDFDLPEDRIALRPAEPRDAARLLVVRPGAARSTDRRVRDLPALLDPGDVLVFNDTKVIPAQLRGHAPARRERRAGRRDAAHARRAGPLAGLRPAGASASRPATASASAMTAMPAFSARSTRRSPKRARRAR